jgi:hypothetical protein
MFLFVVLFLLASVASGVTADSEGFMPIGQTYTPQDVFGGQVKTVHPFLAVAGMYTDNFYNTKNDKKSEYGAIISPGIWFALPGAEKPLLNFLTSTTSAGGVNYSRFIEKSDSSMQGYFSYRADIEQYVRRSSENTESHYVEGLVQFNLRSGLSFNFLDKYVIAHDPRSFGLTSLLDEYDTNFLSAVIDYDVSPKFNFKLDYHNYILDYDSSRNSALERKDNSFSGYVFYKVSAKTSTFLHYEHVIIDYDTSQRAGSSENRGYLGLDWNMTEKTWGRVKVGYGEKESDDSTKDDLKTFLFETQLNHALTAKTTLIVSGFIGNKETNLESTDYLLEKELNVTIDENFTKKLSGFVSLHYARDDYEGKLTYDLETKEVSDDVYSASVGIDFIPYEWLKSSLSYVYSRRDSNFDQFDYTSNSVYLSFLVFM